MIEFASSWGLVAGSLIIAAPVILFKIKEHTDVEADLAFSDETAQEVQGHAVKNQPVAEQSYEKQAPVS
jgi:hypothetical protein